MIASKVNIESRVKSRFWDDKSVFKMRKMGIKNTFDAGVNVSEDVRLLLETLS